MLREVQIIAMIISGNKLSSVPWLTKSKSANSVAAVATAILRALSSSPELPKHGVCTLRVRQENMYHESIWNNSQHITFVSRADILVPYCTVPRSSPEPGRNGVRCSCGIIFLRMGSMVSRVLNLNKRHPTFEKHLEYFSVILAYVNIYIIHAQGSLPSDMSGDRLTVGLVVVICPNS